MLAHFSLWLCLGLHTLGYPVPTSPADHISGQATFHSHERPALLSPGAPPCLNGVINDYTPVLGFGCDSSTLQVGPLTGFAAGDKVLLLQMQVAQVDLSNTAGFGTLLNSTCIGNYEFNRIQSVAGSTIQLQYGLTRPYDVSGKVQLVRVPEYASASVCYLSCLPWNGSVGGVLALDVQGELTLDGNIDVSGRGFRGGNVEQNTITWVFGETQYFYPPQSRLAAAKGEGIVLIPTNQSFGRGRAGNGGGGGNAHNAGGGGGGNGGNGGNGGLEIVNLPAPPVFNTNGIRGQKYFENDVSKIVLGGAAGAGHANDGRGSSGGNGGGIAIILASTLQANNFSVRANGVDVLGGVNKNDGQGGGGAGGTVVLKIGQLNGTLPCELIGGRGGSNPYTPDSQLHGPGGGGGGGKLLLAQNTPGIVPALQGGLNGVTSQSLSNGALPGESGQVLTGFALPVGTRPIHPVSNQLVLAVQPVFCGGLANGRIAVLQSTALAFRLNGGPWQPDSVFTGLTPGSYQIGLRFSGYCTLDTMAVVAILPPVQLTFLSLTPPGCAGGGALRVAAAGQPPFTYQLNNGPWQPTGTFPNLFSGNYTVTVRDAAGCTHSNTYNLPSPSPVLHTLVSLTNATCLSGGAITTMAVAGQPPFAFQLDGGAWQPDGTFTNLPPGNHRITLRDAAGCTYTATYTIPMTPPALDSLVSLANASCNAGGTITVAPASGTAPFEFQLNSGAWQANGLFPNLPPGNHTFTLRDAAGCVHTSTYTIAPPPPVLDSLVSLANASCNAGGTITVAPASGTAPFEFQLNSGAWQANGLFPNLPPGSHSIMLRDAAGCLHTSTYAIMPPPPALDSLLALLNATCDSGGEIRVTPVSGTAPFAFQLNGGAWQTSGTFTNISPGSHRIMLRDAGGCLHTSTYTIMPPPPALDSLLALLHAICNSGGEIAVTPVSGTAPFAFQLNGGAWQTSGTFTNLPAGNYMVTLRDAAGCTDTDTYALSTSPPALDSLLSRKEAGCTLGGEIAVTAISGTAPFEFQLNNGPWQTSGVFTDLPPGDHTVSLRDALGCTHSSSYSIAPPPPALDSLISLDHAGCDYGGTITVAAISGTAPFEFQLNNGPWQTSGAFTDLPPGDHTVSLRDAVGCTHSSSYSIAPPPPALDSLISLAQAGCDYGGALTVAAISGTAPFEFRLDNGPWQTSGVFTDLPSGSHTVSLRDAAGCIHSRTYSVATSSPVLDALISLARAGCNFGGEIITAAVSGIAPFAFQLNNGPWQPSGVFTDLPSGDYTITLRDAAGCTHASTYVVDPPLPLLDSLVSLVGAGCTFGGSILTAAVSGQAPFEFQIDSGAWQANGHFTDLLPGDYAVTLRDAAGCNHTSTYSVPPPPPLLDSLVSLVGAGCAFGGSITTVAASGSAPFAFQLNNGAWQTDGVFTDLLPGDYSITLRDAAGCNHTSNYSVPPPPPLLDALLALTGAGCAFGGSIATTAVSGSAPFEFQLNGGLWQTGGTFSDLPAGQYTVLLRDAAGCRDSSTYMIATPPPALDSLAALVGAGCTFGGRITVAAISGQAPFAFQLNGGPWQAQGDFVDLPAGSYLLTLRDAAGCTHVSTYLVAAPPPAVDSLVSIADASCTVGGAITTVAAAGTAPFEFQLDNGPWQTSGAFTDLPPGSYAVTLRDAAGCTDTHVYRVDGAPPALDSLISLVHASCISGGKIVVAAISGQGPFEFQLNDGTWQSTGTFANLPPGSYVVTLQDTAGCVHRSTYVVASPPPALDSLVSLQDPGCQDEGSLIVAAVSGTAPFQFQLDGGLWQSDGSFTELPPGDHVVSLRDGAGCVHTSAYTLASYEPLQLQLDSLGHVDCRHPLGFLAVRATGGSGQYTYRLNDGSTPQSDGYFSGLPANPYAILVTDSAGCTARLGNLEVYESIDTALTRETITLYEGAYFELPDGRRVGRSGQYAFAAQTTEGCDSLHIIEVIVLERHVYVPNVFRPNDDGENDFWSVFSDASLALVRRLAVYDRWGELVFEQRNIHPNQENNGWDGQFRGRLVDSGVFIWVVELEFVDGWQRTMWGDVTVLR